MRENFTVKLKGADIVIKIEVRDKIALIYSSEREGAKGLPMDTSQRVVCLLSGGIDSPVAAAEIIKRGCTPVFVHFHSKPYTSEATILKVKTPGAVAPQAQRLSLGALASAVLEVQKAVRDNCTERYRTVSTSLHDENRARAG